MQHNSRINISQLCDFIDLLSPSMDDYLYVYDYKNDFYYISPQAVHRFSVPGNAFHNAALQHKSFVYPADLPRLLEELKDLEENDRCTHNMHYRWLSVDGEPVWINCRGYVVRDHRTALYLIGCINEIGTRPKADNISGLLGDSSLQLYLKEYAFAFPEGYFLRLSLNGLKEINARLGVNYGNMILKKTAECISACIAPGQKLYRLIEDEFLIVDFLGGTSDTADDLYNRICHSIESFIDTNNYEVIYTISGGMVPCSSIDEFSYTHVMKLSEFALARAKRLGKNGCYVFCPEDYSAFLKQVELKLQLQQAVKHNFEGFEVYLQPIFYSDTRILYGAEALLRFRSPKLGSMSPADFIPILEDTGLIIPVGRFILEQALILCKKIQEFIPDFHININLSHVQIAKSNVLRDITAAITKYKILPKYVTIELTENGLLESDPGFSRVWSGLKRFGVSLALDDFGSGYSNFRYLNELQPNILKIDQTFTANAFKNDYAYKLLSLFSGLAHALNLKVCIEGIESESEYATILSLCPDYIQGYYLGHPCPCEQFTQQYVFTPPVYEEGGGKSV